MQFKFVGNPHDANDGKVSIVAFGIKFPLNVAVDVENPHVIKKLMGNSHFAAVENGKTFHQSPGNLILPAPAPAPAPSGVFAPIAEPASSMENAQEPANDDIQPADLSKEELIQAAAEYGVTIDKRWSAQRITAVIAAALAERAKPNEAATTEHPEVQSDEDHQMELIAEER
jgi:hypothetical protein